LLAYQLSFFGRPRLTTASFDETVAVGGELFEDLRTTLVVFKTRFVRVGAGDGSAAIIDFLLTTTGAAFSSSVF
jgi:hypothetical protein